MIRKKILQFALGTIGRMSKTKATIWILAGFNAILKFYDIELPFELVEWINGGLAMLIGLFYRGAQDGEAGE